MSGLEQLRCALTAAEAGARWWDLAVRTHRATTAHGVDHGDLYGLAGELVATLRVLDELAGVVSRQAERYGEGRVLRDDAGADPAERLVEAASAANHVRAALDAASRAANDYWSAIGHIGLALDPSDNESDLDDDSNLDHDRPGEAAGGPETGGRSRP